MKNKNKINLDFEWIWNTKSYCVLGVKTEGYTPILAEVRLCHNGLWVSEMIDDTVAHRTKAAAVKYVNDLFKQKGQK